MEHKQSKFKNRRTDSRVDLGFWSYKISILDSQKKEYTVLLENISLGGVGILSHIPFPDNSELHFCISKEQPHYFKGRIKWQEQIKSGKYKCGVQFELDSDKEIEIIKQTITQLFLKMPKEVIVLKAIELFTSGQVLNSQLKDSEKENILMREDFKNFVKEFESNMEVSMKELSERPESEVLEYLYKIYILQTQLANWKNKIDQNYH